MRKLWLLGVLIFLGLVVWQAYRQDPYFYFSAHQMYLRAVRAQQAGDLKNALAWAERAVAREPQSWRYLAFLAWRLLEAHRLTEALERFTQARALQPAEISLGRGEAMVRERLGQRDQALKLVQELLQLQPQDTATLTLAAELAGAAPDTQDLAIHYYQRLHELDPRDLGIRQRLVDLLAARQRFAEAIPLQEATVRDFPNNPQALHQLALLYAWQRDYEGAAEIYDRLLSIEAANQALRREAAQTAEAAQKLDKALGHYLALYRQSGGQAEYARALARIWSQKGEHGSAAAVLAPLLDGAATLEDRRTYALELLLAGDFKGAFSAYRRLWEEGDTSKETLTNLARLAAQGKKFHLAADLWDEARRRHLILGEEWRREAALTYAAAQRYREAVQVLEPVARQDPKLLLFLGQMHFYQRRYGTAAHYYRTYLERSPQDSAVRRQLAQILALDPENRTAALAEYDLLLRQQPTPADRLQKAALLLQLAQDEADRREPEDRRKAAAYWQAAEAELKQLDPAGLSPELQQQQYKLLMWLGAAQPALTCLEYYLAQRPRDREARLDQIRLLIYLRRGREALTRLQHLKWSPGGGADPAASEELLALELEAALAAPDPGAAERAAWRLYLQPLGRRESPASWRAAYRRWQEAVPRPALTPASRVLLGRFLVRKLGDKADPDLVRIGVDLCLANLQEREIGAPDHRRYYQASLLLLSYFLPRLGDFDDLQRVTYRLPGLREKSPEYIATLSHFDGLLGRQGGKLQYLLHTLEDRRDRYPVTAPGDLLYLAALATELRLYSQAAAYLEQAQQLRPQDERLQTWRLQVLMASQDYGRLLKALDQRPATPETKLELARVYLQRQQYDGAVAVLQDFRATDPGWDEAQLLLIQAHKGRGNFPAARQLLQEV